MTEKQIMQFPQIVYPCYSSTIVHYAATADISQWVVTNGSLEEEKQILPLQASLPLCKFMLCMVLFVCLFYLFLCCYLMCEVQLQRLPVPPPPHGDTHTPPTLHWDGALRAVLRRLNHQLDEDVNQGASGNGLSHCQRAFTWGPEREKNQRCLLGATGKECASTITQAFL